MYKSATGKLTQLHAAVFRGIRPNYELYLDGAALASLHLLFFGMGV